MTGAGDFQFRVLGPLEVRLDGTVLGIGGVRQRALLAMLLLNANRVVSRDRLIDELLPGAPADRADQNLRVHISRLRGSLSADGEPPRLVARAPGYLLTVNSGELDLEVFEERLAQGRRASGERDFELAARLFRGAEGLWRGRPLADLEFESFARIEVERLQELRLATLEERIEAELALGQHANLCAELESLVAEHSLRERLQGQLMLALYRSGRQSDALAVYRDASELLRDQLGLEPTRALQDIELAILRQDPSLDAMPQGPTSPAVNLPLAATPFLGRKQELADVTVLLRTVDTRLLTFTGAGGSGKTRLALRIAEACTRDYRDGVSFVAFADISDPDLIAPTICQALGLADEPGLTATQRLQQWLPERELLLLLDNLEQLAAGTAVLGELLASCPRLRLLVTSRVPLRLAGEQQYEVPVLERADAIELFTARARAIAPHLTIDPAVAGQLCERLDRLPLAIELAAARTKTLPPSDILTRLQQRMPVLATGPRDAPQRQHTLQATIDWSYHLLTEDEQQLFARLAVFAGGFTLPAAESICDADLDSLQGLTDRSLIRVEDGRYTMLETLREYALAKLDQTDDDDELRRRHAEWLIELLQPKSGWYAPRAAILQGRPVRELDNLRSALEWATASGEAEITAWLVDAAAWWVWFSHGQLSEADRWIVRAREHETDFPPRLQAKLLDVARELALLRGEFDAGAALCERGLEIYRKIGDPQGVCFALNGRHRLASARGDLSGARAALEEGILVARANDVPGFIPVALNNLADIAIEEGGLNEAQALCEEGLNLAESLAKTDGRADELGLTREDVALRVIPLINLAHIANLQRRDTDAALFGREAVTAALGQDDQRTAAAAMMEIAWPLATQGELERSARLLGAATGFLEAAGITLQRTEVVCEQQARKLLGDQLDTSTLQALLTEGRRMPLEEAVRDALTESPASAYPTAAPPH